MKLQSAMYVAWLVAAVVIGSGTVTVAGHSAGDPKCKELNQINCYMGQNEGYFCSNKDKTQVYTRWYFDKGVCKKFDYKGCYGNRNRFCTKDACERRCL